MKIGIKEVDRALLWLKGQENLYRAFGETQDSKEAENAIAVIKMLSGRE